MTTFEVDVEFSTHALLQEGVCAVGTRRVVVAAADHWEAQEIAAQMVACHDDIMPTRTTIVI